MDLFIYLFFSFEQRGYDFSMVDLRLGVGSPVAEFHNTVELHVENLQRCQETQGPNFIVRYQHVVLCNSKSAETASLHFR
uniref:Uncharacterized protein n=1 Tax=Sander lucioperca TaxID=283035 RepID=A0A8C9XUY7_SANLU